MKPIQGQVVVGKIIAFIIVTLSLPLSLSASEEVVELIGSNHSIYTKLNDSGKILADNARSWSCVRDERSDLVWEVKLDDSSTRGNSRYRWGGKSVSRVALGKYDGSNKLPESRWDGSGNKYRDWTRLVDAANSERLCGFSDWRVPTLYELASLVRCRSGHYKNLTDGCGGNYQKPTIDSDYFPNTLSLLHWSASPYAHDKSSGWAVDFDDGSAAYYYGFRDNRMRVRLVRSSASQLRYEYE